VITTLKLAGLSAILSAGLVSGFAGTEPKVGSTQGKLFYDRVGDTPTATAPISAASARLAYVDVNTAAKGDSVRVWPDLRCMDEAGVSCAVRLDATRRPATEMREPAAAVSTLVRDAGATAVATR
jgi:hypothetical protein